MLKDNYNNNSENVQQLIKIEDYMKLSKEDRQKHIDLTTECQFHYYDRDYNWNGKIKKAGDLYGKSEQKKKAKEQLIKKLDIEDFGGCKIHVCHLCNCNSYTDKICINSAHLYFGTASENTSDIPLETRQKSSSIAGKKGGKIGGKIGGKKAMENGTNCMLQKVQCPHCLKEGSLAVMHRWHFDNCKFKHISVISQNLSNLTQE